MDTAVPVSAILSIAICAVTLFVSDQRRPTGNVDADVGRLQSAVFGEAARIVEGGCTPGFDFLTQLTVSDYSIWFTKVLLLLVGRE